MPILLLDTNFFRNFVEQDSFFAKANAHLASRYRDVPPAEMKLFVSPFSFLEYLGIKVEPPPLPESIIGSHPISELQETMNLVESIFNYAYAYFEQHQLLSQANIASTLLIRESYVHPRAKQYWKIATNRYSRPENRSILIHCLAAEYIQKVPLKRIQAQTYHPWLWLDAARRISEGMDVCMFRTIQWRWSNENRHERIRQFGVALISRLYKAMGVRLNDDLVDGELVHYTTFGKVVDAAALGSVDGYTCDPHQKIKDRIGVFYAGLTRTVGEVNQTIDRGQGTWNFRFPAPSSGTIMFWDSAGNIVDGPVRIQDLVTGADSAQVI